MYQEDAMNENMTYEQKLTKVMMKLRNLRTFYACIYENLEKVESNTIETMGVTTNKLVYNRKFIDDTPFDEFVFINLHEIAHIALMHVTRRENRHPTLWNIACDIYVNQMLLDEFGLEIGVSTCIDNFIDIKPPTNALYCTSIDIDKDYVESIYDELEKQAKSNGFFSGTPSKGKYGNQGKQGNDDSNKYHFEYVGSRRDWKYGSVKTDKFECDIEPDMVYDLIDDGSDQSQKEQQSRKIVSDAMVKDQMMKQAGHGSGNLERFVKTLIKSEVNWKKLLRRYLIKAASSDTSFSNPDKRLYYQDAIYPGKAFDATKLTGVKVCIDVSGSISDDDMSAFFYQVLDLTRKFKISAELIYWDADVKSVGMFNTFEQFKRVNAHGGGGTDASVIFEYFIEHKIKPTVTLVLTDGYFNTNFKEVNRGNKFKDTIWILTKDSNPDFKPPFGKVAYARF